MKVTLYDQKKKKVEDIDLQDDRFNTEVNTTLLHQVVHSQLANVRSGNACTKDRGEVSGSTRKLFKQKGTGNARQGSTRSGLMVGGATIFGPTPRDYTQKVNKKMGLLAIQSILADKLQAGKLTVVDSLESNGKTKEMFALLNGKGLLPALVVTEDKNSNALRAVKNLQWGKGLAVEGFSVYEAVKFENLVIEKSALETLLGKLV